jgi:hypothetical protein
MSTSYRPLKVFLSFARDVDEEGRIAEEVIRRVNQRAKDTLGLLLETTTWKSLPPLAPPPPSTIQSEISEEVRDCNIFVLVLFKRYGSLEPGQSKSNLEREVEIAISKLDTERKIMFLSYFRRLPDSEDPGDQEQKVRDLRTRLQGKGIWYHEYDDPSEFRDRLTHDLYHTILKFRLSTSKHKAVKNLWQLGESDRPTYPELAIVYPPVDRKYLREQNPDQIWLERLVPHLVFEDFKAIQKIEKSLRLINFREFRLYTTGDIPADISYMNRIWLCWPRNERAGKQLEIYSPPESDVARFKFVSSHLGQEAKILWRYSSSSDSYVVVRSPLAKYLQLQRSTIAGGNWTPDKGRIVAKDFAVLSRFSDSRSRHTVGPTSLKDYFIGGIRGLGTWGAGWFIDRKYDAFRRYEHDEPIQLLLEVTYQDGRILDVRDVSDESDSYFKRENSLAYIRSVIRDYKRS